MAAEVGEAVIVEKVQAKRADTVSDRVWREVLSWFWVILAFLVIEGGFVQARVIPSGSMEPTVLIGDHLIVSRFGYDMGIPFTDFHVPLWRNPKTAADHRISRAAAGESGFHQAHDWPCRATRSKSNKAWCTWTGRRSTSRIVISRRIRWRIGLPYCPARRLFHDGRQSREFLRQPLLGLRATSEYYRHAGDHIHVD